MNKEQFRQIQLAYERLSMMHTETMAELVETRKQMDALSKCWWLMLKYRVRCIFRNNPWE